MDMMLWTAETFPTHFPQASPSQWSKGLSPRDSFRRLSVDVSSSLPPPVPMERDSPREIVDLFNAIQSLCVYWPARKIILSLVGDLFDEDIRASQNNRRARNALK